MQKDMVVLKKHGPSKCHEVKNEAWIFLCHEKISVPMNLQVFFKDYIYFQTLPLPSILDGFETTDVLDCQHIAARRPLLPLVPPRSRLGG